MERCGYRCGMGMFWMQDVTAGLASGARAGEGTEQNAGESRPDAGLLMLEVHEHIGARSRAGADGLRPAPEVLGRVALVAQTKIAVARRDLHGGREFLAVGDAEREILRPEPLEHLGVHPRRVPELERGAGVRGKDAEKRIEHREILAEIRRQLEEDGAELGSERRCGPQKVLQEV